jgi:phosphopantetheinyl transferase (holo-ACP synthase)
VNLVGNDVVDLDDAAITSSHLRARFVERVCHARERARVASALEPKVLLWSLFAAKEAAFKVVVKRGPVVFAHRRFVVAEDLGSVGFEGLELRLRVQVTGACVHAVAWLGAAPTSSEVVCIGLREDPGRVARKALLASFGEVDGLEVVREPVPGAWDGYGPPRVRRSGFWLPVDVSLSHDGRFAAYAVGAPDAQAVASPG